MEILVFTHALIFGSRGAIATKKLDLIKELSVEFGQARFDILKHPIFQRLRGFKKNRINGYCLFVCGPGSDTYAHWVFDTLPRLLTLRDEGFFKDVGYFILSYKGHGFQLDTLAWLGVPMDKVINLYNRNDVCFVTDSLVTCTYPSNFNSVSDWVVSKLQRFYFVNAETTDTLGPRFVFIDRKDNRKVTNIGFYGMLQAYDFETVFAEEIPESHKPNFFRNVQCLISVYGSGGQNIIHCCPNCLLISIDTEKHYDTNTVKFVDVYGWTLNNGGGYRTAIIIGQSTGNELFPVEINLTELEFLLKQFL
jgi:capsular polysaccharide biosynthesis protein